MFYFQQLFNTALAGIDGTSIIPTVIGIAYGILLISFLVGLYQAAMRGGDLQALAIAGIKYLIIALILANWSSAFRQVNTGFDSVSQFIGNSSGAGDMFSSWGQQLKQQYDQDGNFVLWDLITGEGAGQITALLLLVAYILYGVAVAVFCFFYTLFGCVLYVLGPLVLALLPMAAAGQLAKSYATNLMIWNAWSLLYSTFGALMTAIQVNQVSNILNKQGFIGFFQGLADSTLLGLVSIFYAISLALIPMIARRIISGEVGGTVFSLVKSAAVVAGYAMAGAAGFSAETGRSGAAAGAGGAPSLATSGAATGASAASSGAIASSMPPPVPSMGETLRAHIASALGGQAPRGVGGGVASSNGGPRSTRQHAASSGMKVFIMQPGSSFHPHGVGQRITFTAGRLAGSAVRSIAARPPQQSSPSGEASPNE